MALVKPIVFQIVGYQNSGKTTLMSRLIERLSSEGVNVVSIKHHGHGGKPEAVPNKDSSKHLHSGAVASMVEGEGHLLLQALKPIWTLEEKIQLLSFFNPDIILIEGHKKATYPKLLLIRNRDDLELLKITNNIQAVISWEEIPDLQLNLTGGISAFHITDEQSLDYILTYLKNQL
jgi:molybdopterin-guanine dinucleotide biosynthesis protein B